MAYLADTHTLVWWAFGDRRLSRKARALLDDQEQSIVLSTVSAIEIGTKLSIGKITLSGFDTPEQFFGELRRQRPFRLITVTMRHGCELARLPRHHRDPFDRLLVSQALLEGHTLITNDRDIARYSAKTVW
ncbi:MAG: PIN domain-containing protein [Planctomycetes bacterium]|jgi:PIN domain nuclease of toxin-antitoxin system|nr:PIN domain-containing protein [Planctomycetota bacterium]